MWPYEPRLKVSSPFSHRMVQSISQQLSPKLSVDVLGWPRGTVPHPGSVEHPLTCSVHGGIILRDTRTMGPVWIKCRKLSLHLSLEEDGEYEQQAGWMH